MTGNTIANVNTIISSMQWLQNVGRIECQSMEQVQHHMDTRQCKYGL